MSLSQPAVFYTTVTRIARAVLPTPIAVALQTTVRLRRDACNRAKREAKERLWERGVGTDGSVREKVADGVFLDLPFDSELARLIYLGGYEETERSFVQRVLRKGDIFVDVGANIGLYSVLAAKAVGASGVVYAFEPVGKTFRRLLNNVQLNHFQNVRCYCVGLSSCEGWSEITTSADGFDAWSSFGVPVEGAQHARETVRTTTWDSFVQSEGLGGRVKLVKVDIEGWEGHFLRGAATDLASPAAPHLLIEFNDDAAKAAGFSGATVYGMLDQFGYSMFRYDGSTNSLSPEPVQEHYNYVNLVATKRVEELQHLLAGHGR